MNSFSDKVLVDEGMEMMTAGTDTTSDSTTLGMVHVLDNPQIYARLRAEITEAWPLDDQPPAHETLEKLPYLVRNLVTRKTFDLNPPKERCH